MREAVLATTPFHAAIHHLSLKIYNLFLKFLVNSRHYMDVCPNGNSLKPVVRGCSKCRWTHTISSHIRRKHVCSYVFILPLHMSSNLTGNISSSLFLSNYMFTCKTSCTAMHSLDNPLISREDWIKHPIAWKVQKNEASEIWSAQLPGDQSRCGSFCPELSKIFPDPLYGKMERLRRPKDSFINRKPSHRSRIVGPLAMAAAIHFRRHFLNIGCSIQSSLEISGTTEHAWTKPSCKKIFHIFRVRYLVRILLGKCTSSHYQSIFVLKKEVLGVGVKINFERHCFLYKLQ